MVYTTRYKTENGRTTKAEPCENDTKKRQKAAPKQQENAAETSANAGSTQETEVAHG